MDMQTDPFTSGASEGGEAMPDDAMDDSELVSILKQHEVQAIGYTPGGDDEISAQQEKALNYYYGIMDDVPAQEGCSAVVDRTVQVVVDNALSALLKPFLSSDETVCFTPREQEDVEFAEQATEYVNFIFNHDNPGALILYTWFKDAILTKLGVVKIWWEDERKIEDRQEVELQDEMMASMVRDHPDYMGEQDGVATLGRVVNGGKVKIEPVPPEEFRISPMSRDIKTAVYTAHVPLNTTRSDLVEMGFDPEIVEHLPALSGSSIDNTIRVARFHDERIGDETVGAPHSSQERLALRDEYIRVDYDGDGVAELRRVLRVEDTVLLNEEVEDNPFATLCPVPMPHKVYGLSLADLAIEPQKVATVLWRQTLDNLYKSNNPRPVIGDGAFRQDGSTVDSLQDNAPGAAILLAEINQFRFDAVPFVSDKSYPMLEAVGQMAEERTGVSRAGQGLDTNSLKRSGQMTATEMSMIQGGKNARTEMVARIFAETGVRRLFELVLKNVVTHQQEQRIIRLRNKFIPIDPRGWPEMDVEISVGLGVGDKAEQLMLADSVIQTLAGVVQSPFSQLVNVEKAHNAIKRKLSAAGIKNTDDYLVEPSEIEQQPPQPSPEQQKMQADMQMQQAKMQSDQEMQQARLQMDIASQQHKQELAQQQAEFEAQLASAKAAQEADLARQKMALEVELAQQKLSIDAALRTRQSEQAHEHKMASLDSEDAMPANRPGGSLAE